jgi:CRISPR-associated protein Csx3
MFTNLFPAILIAGAPHCGKSVLAFQLTNHLRRMGFAHYLLRAVPDGEGNWYLEGVPALMRSLRARYKTSYTSVFTRHMCQVIDDRILPLLVDIGGKPQGQEFEILGACTHSILLYHTQEELTEWHEYFAPFHLTPVTELRSTQVDRERIDHLNPLLTGVITGLEREEVKRSSGIVFGSLLDRVAGLCHYSIDELERIHEPLAPFPLLSERKLARQIGLAPRGQDFIWEPADLLHALENIPMGSPVAIYGRGPVWLAACLAAQVLPQPAAIFDVRYGWVEIPSIKQSKEYIPVSIESWRDGDVWLQYDLAARVLETDDLILPETIPSQGGIALSGNLPRWAFAALARNFARERPWVAIDYPQAGVVVVVHSKIPNIQVGDTLQRPTV